MSGQEKWSQTLDRPMTDGYCFREDFYFLDLLSLPQLPLLSHTVISPLSLFHSLPLSVHFSFSPSVSDFLWHTLPPIHTHTHTLTDYSFNLRPGRCRMASECEKGTSSSVYRALLSTHPLPQWPHWGWAQVKAYLKGLFNTEKRGRIPKPQGREGGGRERDSQRAPRPPPQLFL